MATTSIWAVKGWLGKVVLYIENPDKTDNPKFYRQEELTDVQTQSLSDVIDYAVRAEKTTVTPDDESAMVVRQFISGINCLPSTARDEMLAVKKRFGKEDGVIAYHGYQSFAPGEATPELAHEIGVKLAQRLWGERYQVLVATHLDKENHLHNHFVLNRQRIEEVSRTQNTEYVGWDFPGGHAEADKEDNRLRLYFDRKPTEEQRSKLKYNGFRWAPSVGAWQRQLNDNAIYAASRLDFLRPESGESPTALQPKAPAKSTPERG